MALRRLAVAAGGLLLASVSCAARADLLIAIDKSDQRMTVTVDGSVRHVWPVSTGRRGYGTPNGRFRPQWLARRYFSRKYYNSPMPYAIFFHKGYAIHGTEYIRRLGGPASHGCVRLHPKHAAELFTLVKEHGKADTRIVVTGANPVEIARPRREPRARREGRGIEARPRAAREAQVYRLYPAYRAPAWGFFGPPAYARGWYEGGHLHD